MSDENTVRDTADAVKGAAEALKPVYDDALQKAARRFGNDVKPAGTALAQATVTLAKGINIVLAPLEMLVWRYEQVKESFLPALAEKLKGKEGRVVTPPLMVAGPAIEALKYAGSEPTLREMYVNLLATAMDADTAQKAHPAFVEIIRQLLPDEARLLQWLTTTGGAFFPLKQDDREPALTWNMTRPAGCEHPNMVSSYLDNLVRLGLVRHAEGGTSDENWGIRYTASVTVTSLGECSLRHALSRASPTDTRPLSREQERTVVPCT